MNSFALNPQNYSRINMAYRDGADHESYFSLAQQFGVKYFPAIPANILGDEEKVKQLIAIDPYALVYLPAQMQTPQYMKSVKHNHEILFIEPLVKKVDASIVNWALDHCPDIVYLGFFSKPNKVFNTMLAGCEATTKEVICNKIVLNMLLKGCAVPPHLQSYSQNFSATSAQELLQNIAVVSMYGNLDNKMPNKPRRDSVLKV